MGRIQNASLLTTLHENVGDDLIRYGVMHLVASIEGADWRWRMWTKSNPLSAALNLGSLSTCTTHRQPRLVRRCLERAQRGLKRLPGRWQYGRVLGADVVILCGTPLIYLLPSTGFHISETWPHDLLAIKGLAPTKPMVAVGVGSILRPNAEEALARHPEAASLIRELFRDLSLFYCRDSATLQLLQKCGVKATSEANLGPCPSLWAVDHFGIRRRKSTNGPTLCISFSLESSDWAANAAEDLAIRWRLISALIARCRQEKIRIKYLAHNEIDVRACAQLKAKIPAAEADELHVVDARGLLGELSDAIGLVTWRVHGAMAARSLEVPTLLIATDSRFLTAAECGVETVPNADESLGRIQTLLGEWLQETPGVAGQGIAQLKDGWKEKLRRMWQSQVSNR